MRLNTDSDFRMAGRTSWRGLRWIPTEERRRYSAHGGTQSGFTGAGGLDMVGEAAYGHGALPDEKRERR